MSRLDLLVKASTLPKEEQYKWLKRHTDNKKTLNSVFRALCKERMIIGEDKEVPVIRGNSLSGW
jgi:hypothetical protein